MKRENFITDFDDTLFNTRVALDSYLNKIWGIDLKEYYLHYKNEFREVARKFTGKCNMTLEDVYNFYIYEKKLTTSVEWHKENIKPLEYVCEIIPKLSGKYDLYIATSRCMASMEVVSRLLRMYIPGCIQYIHFVNERVGDTSNEILSKKEFIQILKGKSVAFIDDSLIEIGSTQDIVPSFLFDPNGEHNLAEGIQKVKSWKEIGEMFL